MSVQQLELMPAKKPKVPGRHLARRMIAILIRSGGWVTRKEFAAFGITDRECRSGRKASHGRILYGQRGYKMLRNAKTDEIRACLATTQSMIAELQEEHRILARRSHRLLAGDEL